MPTTTRDPLLAYLVKGSATLATEIDKTSEKPLTLAQTIHWLVDSSYTMHGSVKLSSGDHTNIYRDVRSAILGNAHIFREFYRMATGRFSAIGTGASGALILGLIGRGHLYNPKDHGVTWSPVPPPRSRVVLVDDLSTSGGTLMRLRDATAPLNVFVEGSVVAYTACERLAPGDRDPRWCLLAAEGD